MKTLKKTLALLLALAMLLAMAACGGTTAPETEPKQEETAPVVEEPVAAEPVISITEESTYKKPLPNVPEVPYWFPADLLNWVPNENGTDVYNVSSIPLAERVADDKLSTVNTETVTWEFPGASVETSTDAAPVVSYAEEGTYTVKVTAKNASGEAVEEKVGLITVTSKVTGDLSLVSGGKETSASAYVNDNEAPPFAVDGDYTKKWCATGNPPHTLTIDLGEVVAISEVKIFHAQAGNESPDMNTKAYTIQVSEDGETFVDVVKVTKNTEGQTSDTFAAVNARYVKLVVEKPTQGSDTAARIYEVEVYGLNEAL